MADAPTIRKASPPASGAGAVRLMLVAERDGRRGAPADSRVRRFRLARVALGDPPRRPAGRHDHLRRVYD